MTGSTQGGRRGEAAEQHALVYLQQQGLSLVTRNYLCRLGEIDLVMTIRDTLVFVEVRQRTNPGFGSAAESVTRSKQQKLIKAANHYLNSTGQHTRACRFDVVAISGPGFDRVEWIQDAFQ